MTHVVPEEPELDSVDAETQVTVESLLAELRKIEESQLKQTQQLAIKQAELEPAEAALSMESEKADRLQKEKEASYAKVSSRS